MNVPDVRWTKFYEPFSGLEQHFHRCIAHPIREEHICAVDNEIYLNLCSSDSQLRQQLVSHYQNQLVSIEEILAKLESHGPGAEFRHSLEEFRDSSATIASKTRDLLKNMAQISEIIQLMESGIDTSQAEDLSKTGGQRGWVFDKFVEADLPLLKGCVYWDEPSSNEVPYLSLEHNSESSKYVGIGCTVLDPILGQVIPATIGGRMRGLNSGMVVPICGVRKDLDFNVVVPYSNLDWKKPAEASECPDLLVEIIQSLSNSDKEYFEKLVSTSVDVPEIRYQSSTATEQSSASVGEGKLSGQPANEATAVVLQNNLSLAQQVSRALSMADKEIQTSDSARSRSSLGPKFIANDMLQMPARDAVASDSYREQERRVLEFETPSHEPATAPLSPANKSDLVALNITNGTTKVEVKKTFEELFNATLQEFSADGQKPEILQTVEHVTALVQQKREAFKQILGERQQAFSEHHQDLIQRVQTSSIGDDEEKKKLIDEMEQQKRFMDEIVAQEHARQLSMFERAQIEAAERRLRKAAKQVQQQEAEAAACFGNLSSAQLAAQRMQLDMERALEDSISDELSNAAEQRVQLIHNEQQEVLEALAAAAGAPNSDEIMEQLIGRYEVDVDGIEAQVRQALADSISQISAKMEVELSRKLARLRVKTEKAKAKKHWQQVRLMVKMGSLTMRGAKTSQELLHAAEARQQQQQQGLIAALEVQERLEICELTDSLSIAHDYEIAKAESAFAAEIQAVTDDELRDRLIKDHQARLDEMKQQQERDRQRQLEELNDKLRNRRRRIQELDALHKEEIVLLSTAGTSKEAELVGRKTEIITKQEQERAHLLQALEQGAKLEQSELIRTLDNSARLETAQRSAKLAEILATTDDEGQRKALLAAHEAEMEAFQRQMNLEKHRQLEELKDRIGQRRKRQVQSQDELQEEALKLSASADTVERADLIGRQTEAIVKQEEQRVALMSSLDELAGAERDEALRATDIAMNNTIAEKESSLIAKLDSVEDLAERARLLQLHDLELEALKKRLEVDKERQLGELEQRCKDRKKRKLDQTLSRMHEDELKLLASPDSAKEAELIGMKVEVLLKQESDTAQLNVAIAEQNAVEHRVLRVSLEAKQDAAVASAKAELASQLLGKDGGERDRLIALHEFDLARIRADAALAQAKVEDELHRSLQERRDKKRIRLEQQHARQQELIGSADSKESATKAIESAILESSVEIEHEKKAAKMLYNVVSESQSEVKLLRNELSEKSAQIIQNEEARLAYEISQLDPTSSDRQILLQVFLLLLHEILCYISSILEK